MKIKNPVITAQEYELVDIDSIQPHPRNPRKGDVGAIEASIDVNGFYGAVICQRSSRNIIAGNHRWKTMKKLGYRQIPVIWVDVDDDRALKILLADNRTNDRASYNDEALLEILKDIRAEASLEGTGYGNDDVDAMLAAIARANPTDDDDGPEPQIDRAAELQQKWNTARGQIWKVGRHRVMCGDATNEADVKALLEGAVPVLMVTDPPYGVEYDASWRLEAGIHKIHQVRAEGKVSNDDRSDWTEAWKLFPGDVVYVWHAAGALSADVMRSLVNAGFGIRMQIIWSKPSLVIGRGHYHMKHEPCWYGVKKDANAHWIGDRKQSTVWDIPNAHRTQGSVDDGKTCHSTQKPVECMARPMKNHAGDVYDPFLGSGTTVVAAEKIGRIAYGMELEPGYVGVILQRLSDLGLTPELLNG